MTECSPTHQCLVQGPSVPVTCTGIPEYYLALVNKPADTALTVGAVEIRPCLRVNTAEATPELSVGSAEVEPDNGS